MADNHGYGTEEVTLEIAVRDTGVGIPPSRLDRIFYPFTEAADALARRLEGTGLGLPISRNLIAMMGGRIWVESEEGKGSTFYFTVPLPLAAKVPIDAETSFGVAPAASRELRILLVEDNAANQKLATYILQDRGHLVEIAGDGQESLYLTEQNNYDVIVMDMQMPEMDGLEYEKTIVAVRDPEAQALLKRQKEDVEFGKRVLGQISKGANGNKT